MKTFLTDVDGVLLDWFHGLRKWLLKKGITTEPGDPTNWSLRDYIHHPDVDALVAEFNASQGFGKLPAYTDARYVLRQIAHDSKIVAITSCSADSVTQNRRYDNLHDHFGKIFEDIICLPLRESKVPQLKKFPAGCLWIEDRPEGAEAGLEAGHRPVLLTRSYNKTHEHPQVTRCQNWIEILDLHRKGFK